MPSLCPSAHLVGITLGSTVSEAGAVLAASACSLAPPSDCAVLDSGCLAAGVSDEAPPQAATNRRARAWYDRLMRGNKPQVLTGRKLPRSFYSRPVLVVARDCIGK